MKINLTLPILPLALLFIALKLIGVISWSWLWVLSPLWLPLAILLGILLLVTLTVMTRGKRK